VAGDCDKDARTFSAPQPHHFILNRRSAGSTWPPQGSIVTGAMPLAIVDSFDLIL
jgi:hypothetical protein